MEQSTRHISASNTAEGRDEIHKKLKINKAIMLSPMRKMSGDGALNA
jgi:hypothetical protein